MTRAASRIVNNVSYVMWINHDSHFAWQVQLLVMSEVDSCYSAHCNNVSCVKRINDECYFSWRAQYLVSLDNDTC